MKITAWFSLEFVRWDSSNEFTRSLCCVCHCRLSLGNCADMRYGGVGVLCKGVVARCISGMPSFVLNGVCIVAYLGTHSSMVRTYPQTVPCKSLAPVMVVFPSRESILVSASHRVRHMKCISGHMSSCAPVCPGGSFVWRAMRACIIYARVYPLPSFLYRTCPNVPYLTLVRTCPSTPSPHQTPSPAP